MIVGPLEHLTSLQAIVDAEALLGRFHDQDAAFGALFAVADRHVLAAAVLYADAAIRLAESAMLDAGAGGASHGSIRRQLRMWLTERFVEVSSELTGGPDG